MALHSIRLLRVVKRTVCLNQTFARYSSLVSQTNNGPAANTKSRLEDNFYSRDDPDTFGNLSKVFIPKSRPDDEGDIKEELFIKEKPFHSQKLTNKQYADLIKQYLKHKRLKEAIDILEVRMLTDDRVKPENYIYNILIGACADVGYTKKAFKLFNDMKRRALQPTGDTYTCLFTACVNSPWQTDGLNRATHLRNLMIEKGIEPNVTNYNVMIKAFGRWGDLKTAFKIVDEMIDKKIKIRVHTFNHLLHACISDKENGLRHALVLWRKMLNMREKPNIYSFNLMLKCVKECNIGNMSDMEQLIDAIQGNKLEMNNGQMLPGDQQLLLDSSKQSISNQIHNNSTQSKKKKQTINIKVDEKPEMEIYLDSIEGDNKREDEKKQIIFAAGKASKNTTSNLVKPESRDSESADKITLTFINQLDKVTKEKETRLPNLLSKKLNLNGVLGLTQIKTVQEKFAIIGGMDDFLKEMAEYSIKPDIKTFTQLLMVVDDNHESEIKLMERIKEQGIFADIDFYNMLIKKRCFRLDYDGALDVKNIIKAENKARKKKHPLKKKIQLKLNIMTYGVLALSCNTKDSAVKLLEDMKENKLKVNAEILGTLLRNATLHPTHPDFSYINYVINQTWDENVEVNQVFVKRLEEFNERCLSVIAEGEKSNRVVSKTFIESYNYFYKKYKRWLKQMDLEEVLSPPHPWEQFNHAQPETIQRQNIVIEEPKKFYKRDRRYVRYVPRTEA